MMLFRSILLLTVAVLDSALLCHCALSANLSNCVALPTRTALCVSEAFPGAEQCIVLPTQNTSLTINTTCLDNTSSTLLDTMCHRALWKQFARCLATEETVVDGNGATTYGPCRPFVAEADCWSNVALASNCTGSLSGICAAGFGYAKVNCTQLSPSLIRMSSCPIANGLLLCSNCTVTMSLTDQVAVVAAASGLKLINPHNQMFVFPNVTAYASNVTQLLEAIADFAHENEVASFLGGNDLPFYANIVQYMAKRYYGASSKFFVTYLRAPLTQSISQFPNVLFLSGRLDLLAYVAGYTLATASKSRVVLYSSHYPTSTFEREFFIGFASGARDVGNITILWGTTLPESLAARAALSVDGVSSGSSPQLIYPFLSQGVFGIGTFADYLIDPTTFNGLNTTQSRNLLFSVIGNLNTAVVAQFSAAAVGNFITGLWSGDASAVTVAPCVFSCSNISSDMLGSMRRSIALVHRLGATSTIDFTTGELIIPRSPLSMVIPVNATGPDPASVFLSSQPKVVAINFERVALVSLSEPVVSSRVVMFSMAVGHLQPTFLAADNTLTTPQRRYDCAVATDSVSGRIFISMGYDAVTSTNLLGDVWALTVPQFFQMTASWVNLATASAQVAPRFGHSMVFYNGTLFVFGGATASDMTSLALPVMHRFDVNSSQWLSDGASLEGSSSSSGRVYHGMVTYTTTSTSWGGIRCAVWVIVAGGLLASDPDSSRDELLFYCPTYDLWRVAHVATNGGLIGSRVNFCLSVMSASYGSALIIFGGDGVHEPSTTLLADIASGGTDVVAFSEVDIAPATGETSCIAVANSAMKIANDWAHAVVNAPPSTNSTALSYYWPAPLSCTPNGASINTFSRFTCTTCSDQSYSDATASHCIACGRTDDGSVNQRCTDDSKTFLIAFVTALVGALLVVLIPLAVRAVQSFRNLRRMEQSERIGVELAKSISSLDFDRLEFLSSLKNPTRLQRAFLTILTILVTYLQFMPNWVLAGNRVKPDRRKAADRAHYGDASSPRLRLVDQQESGGDDDALPHRIPKLSTTSNRQRSGGRQDNASLAHPSDDDDDAEDAGDNDTPLSIEQRVKRFQHKMLEAWVVVLYLKLSPELASLWTIRVARHGGGVSERPDLDCLNAFSSGLTERADFFHGLIETSINNRIVISFNGWRCAHDPELQAVRCAASIGLMVDAFKSLSTNPPLSHDNDEDPHNVGGGGGAAPSLPPGTAPVAGRGNGVHGGIACGFAHVGIIGRRHGQFSTILGPPMQEAMMYSSVAELYDHRIVVPHLKMKTCLGGKIALRIVGEVTIGGSSSSSSSRSNDAGSGAFETTISPRALSVSSAGQPERHLLSRVVGKRRGVAPANLQSLESLNTLMEYVFQGAKAAAETQLLRDSGATSSATSASGQAHSKSSILIPEDRKEVEAAIAFGSVPRLDTTIRHAPSAPLPAALL